MNTIGERIRGLRDDMDITQAQLAHIVGVTKATMSKYENNIAIPKGDIVGKIADILQTSADYLVGRTDNKAPQDAGVEWTRLTPDEAELLAFFRRLSGDNKARVQERAVVLLEGQCEKAL